MINWNQYCDHVYFIHLENSNEKSFIDILKNINLYDNPILSIEYYIIDKNFYEYKYLKDAKILDCFIDADHKNYNNIIIFRDDLLFENEETINNILLECKDKDISILNPNDICEDILFINKKVIQSIYNNFDLNNIYKEDKWNTKIKKFVNHNFNIYRSSNSIAIHKIDYILPYVNFNDKEWQKNFIKYYNNEPFTEYNQKNRWDRDNFIYAIRSIAKNLPWINNLFIIVESESQVPDCIIKDNVKIIYHKNFIPKEFLPTYNSCAIESFLYNINELSEYFLYANDDMIILKLLSKNHFFEKGKTKNNFVDNILDNTNYEQVCNNSYDIINLEFKNKIIEYKRCIHTPHAMIKSYCMHVGVYHKEILYKTITRFRNNKNINQYMYPIYEMMIGNNIENKKLQLKFIRLNQLPIDFYNKTFRKYNLLGVENSLLSENSFILNELNNFLANKFNKQTIYDNYENKIKQIEHKQANDNIYVSFTSWKERIEDCHLVFKMMLNQTLLPTKIILNLAEEEFPNKEKDLPKKLIDIVNKNNLCEIYWVKKNYKTFKKIIHTLNRYPNDIVISIDDDFPYPNNFIETLYNDYMNINRSNPISYSDWKNENGLYCHYGAFTITEFKFYGERLNQVLEEFVYSRYDENYKCFDDNVYTEVAKLNGYYYVPGSINYNKNRLKIHKYTKNSISERTETYNEDIKNYILELKRYLKKYNISNNINNIDIKVAVCAIIKMEKNYILEWINHYLNLGFDKIILYDNNDIDGESYDNILEKYINDKIVIIENKRGQKFNQVNFYRECYKKYSDDFDWIAFFDIDEFLELEIENNIKDYLSKDIFKSFDYIRICWKTYTDNNQIKVINNNYNCKERFTEILDKNKKKCNTQQKCIYKTKNDKLILYIHNAIPVLNPCNAIGIQELSEGIMLPEVIWGGAWINHYLTKSLEEYIFNKCLKHINKNNRDDDKDYPIYVEQLKSLRKYWYINKKTPEKLQYLHDLLKKFKDI